MRLCVRSIRIREPAAPDLLVLEMCWISAPISIWTDCRWTGQGQIFRIAAHDNAAVVLAAILIVLSLLIPVFPDMVSTIGLVAGVVAVAVIVVLIVMLIRTRKAAL